MALRKTRSVMATSCTPRPTWGERGRSGGELAGQRQRLGRQDEQAHTRATHRLPDGQVRVLELLDARLANRADLDEPAVEPLQLARLGPALVLAVDEHDAAGAGGEQRGLDLVHERLVRAYQRDVRTAPRLGRREQRGGRRRAVLGRRAGISAVTSSSLSGQQSRTRNAPAQDEVGVVDGLAAVEAGDARVLDGDVRVERAQSVDEIGRARVGRGVGRAGEDRYVRQGGEEEQVQVGVPWEGGGYKGKGVRASPIAAGTRALSPVETEEPTHRRPGRRRQTRRTWSCPRPCRGSRGSRPHCPPPSGRP